MRQASFCIQNILFVKNAQWNFLKIRKENSNIIVCLGIMIQKIALNWLKRRKF